MYWGFYPHLPWAPHAELYNCSGKTAEEWLARGTVRPLVGWSLIGGGMLVVMLYSLVIYAMACKEFLRHSCYQLMFFSSILDVLNMFFDCVVAGFLLLEGVTYCSHPQNFIIGALAEGVWIAACIACVALGLSRLTEVTGKCKQMFTGKMIIFWVLVSIFGMLYCMFFTHTMIYNSTAGGYFFVPFLTDDIGSEVRVFVNLFHPFINFSTGTIIVVCYIIIFTYIAFRRKSTEKSNGFQRKLLLQSLLICGSMASTAYLYVVIQFVAVPEQVHLIAMALLFMCDCAPMIVYLTMNQAIRRKVIQLLGLNKLLGRVEPSYIPTGSNVETTKTHSVLEK